MVVINVFKKAIKIAIIYYWLEIHTATNHIATMIYTFLVKSAANHVRNYGRTSITSPVHPGNIEILTHTNMHTLELKNMPCELFKYCITVYCTLNILK